MSKYKQTHMSLTAFTEKDGKVKKTRVKRPKSDLSEDDLQKLCVRWFEIQYRDVLLHHSPNGGSRHLLEAVKLKAMGTRPGCPDILIFHPGKLVVPMSGLAIELKIPGGKVTEHQKNFQHQLAVAGWYTEVVWSFEEFQNTVNKYFGKNS